MGSMPRKDYVSNKAVIKLEMNTVLAGDTVTVNGNVYTGVAGVKADDTEFSVDTSNTAVALDLADSIDDDARIGTETVAIVATSDGIFITVVATGVNADRVIVGSSDTIIRTTDVMTLLGLESNPKPNNETVKRVNHMNSPYSVQATGNDLVEGRLHPVRTEAEFNALATRQRVLLGNEQGWLKTVTASTSLVFVTLDNLKQEQLTTLTMAEVIDGRKAIIFFAKDYV